MSRFLPLPFSSSMEKALAQLKSIQIAPFSSPPDETRGFPFLVDGGIIGVHGYWTAITGKTGDITEEVEGKTNEAIRNLLRDALADNSKTVVIGTRRDIVRGDLLADRHAYFVSRMDPDGTLHLFNPWGRDKLKVQITINDFARLIRQIEILSEGN